MTVMVDPRTLWDDRRYQGPTGAAIGEPKEKIRIEPLEVPVPSKAPAPVEPMEVPEKEPVR